MRRGCWIPTSITCAVLSLFIASSASADVFNDIGLALDYAGFNFLGRENVNIQGRENRLSGGTDFLTSVNFVGNPLDFGPGDLVLSGPVSVDISSGGRALRTLDISFQTALSGDSIATPLAYSLNLDSGSQVATIQGTLLLDADLSVNQFGFYDLAFTYSSRQNVTTAGRFADDISTNDLDIGPIHVRGNFFADVLALITEPLFQAAGQPNLFASFSESARLKEVLEAATDSALASADAPGNSFTQNQFLATRDGSIGRGISATGSDARIVPEPTVLVLMLLGVPAIISRRHRSRLASR